MIALWKTLFFQPLYNGLIVLINILPGASVGLAVIVLTLVVKIILSPLSWKSSLSQIKQQELQPHLKTLRDKYPDKKEQSQKMIEFYKEHKTNPFAGCLLILLQLPIILALYQVFLKGVGDNIGLLYTSVAFPQVINPLFLGFIDMTEKSILLAVVAGITQFFQIYLLQKRIPTATVPSTTKNDGVPTMADMAQSMQKNMKFFMPIMITVFAAFVPSAVALYWVVSNLFSIGQEMMIKRRITSR